MKGAIGVIELNSIAKGLMAVDLCLKTAALNVLMAQTVCPGKYLIVADGSISSIKSAVEAVKEEFAEYIIDVAVLGNIHIDVFKAIGNQMPIPENGNALGVLELFTVPAGILAADHCAKTAVVRLADIQLARGMAGKSVIFLTGDIGAVQAAVDSVVAQYGAEGLLGSSAVLASPHEELWPVIW